MTRRRRRRAPAKPHYVTGRGDELPEHLATREGRRTALREAKERLGGERSRATDPADRDEEVAVELAPERS